MQYVVDASFVLAYLLPDEYKDRTQEIFEQYSQHEISIISPSLLSFEVGNVLVSGVQSKRLPEKQAFDLYEIFDDFAFPVREPNFARVLKLSIAADITYYDASYVILAKDNQASLLTFDRKLKEIADKYLGN
ncbi:MAG: hypothetical protein COY80_01730 [Candidatus Pacebacteria bacterium CG_4_10_14_0_8_um_filter_42_14]|nr:MAG: hypothetical protein COY80_01730 [Candidatus Pacebacteria bacterium CG_4_10_14_0_8_um_filter_42_14]